MPQDGSALLGMPDIKPLSILKILCEVIDAPHESSKFNLQTTEAPNDLTCRTNEALHNKTNEVDTNVTNANMPDCFRSNINKTADKRGSKVLINKLHSEFGAVFQE